MMLKNIQSWIKRHILPSLIAFTAKFSMRLLLRTCRIEVEGFNHLITTVEKSPCILVLWHEHLAIIPEILHRYGARYNYTAFISNSRDGEPLARLVNSYKIGRVLRVPHNTRHLALTEMIHQLKTSPEIMIVTPDGPRGPRRVIKPGVNLAVKETGAKLIPFSWESNRYWRLSSWDKMIIPKPFSTIKVSFGKEISLY